MSMGLNLNKLIFATLMKLQNSVSNIWLAELWDMGHPASVSLFVGMFERSESREQKKVNKHLSRSKV